mmetsp:Transcript_22915/g.53089  ORF Transcript_22915/g.53089 Transcript_22915/m.53089 type:complete len:100 (-) Transcript_22915:2003-2302(-)
MSVPITVVSPVSPVPPRTFACLPHTKSPAQRAERETPTVRPITKHNNVDSSPLPFNNAMEQIFQGSFEVFDNEEQKQTCKVSSGICVLNNNDVSPLVHS